MVRRFSAAKFRTDRHDLIEFALEFGFVCIVFLLSFLRLFAKPQAGSERFGAATDFCVETGLAFPAEDGPFARCHLSSDRSDTVPGEEQADGG